MPLEQRLALRVLRARDAALVPRGPVRLDDHARLRPPEVGNQPAPVQVERDVDVRVGEAAAEHQVEHDVLEFAARRRRSCRDDAGEQPRAAAPVEPIQHGADLPGGHLVPGLGLADGATQRPLVQHCGEVEQRPHRRRDGDAAEPRDVARAKQAGAMGVDSRMDAGRRRRDVGLAPVPRGELPQDGGRAVAQHGARPAREHGGEEPALERRRGVADGVHRAMQGMQAPAADPVCHGVRGQARGPQVGERHHAPLPRGATGDQHVRSHHHVPPACRWHPQRRNAHSLRIRTGFAPKVPSVDFIPPGGSCSTLGVAQRVRLRAESAERRLRTARR